VGDDDPMLGGRLRRIRRWIRTTPDKEIAINVMGAGCVCLLVAGVYFAFHTGWL
jgi:hypothetical protein